MRTRPRPCVPEADGRVATADQLKFFCRIKQHFLYSVRVAVELDLASRLLSFWVPDPDGLVGGTGSDLTAGRVPRDRPVAVGASSQLELWRTAV